MTEKNSRCYQDLLVNELNSRREQNPRFSMRSFARLLDISPAQLSQLMSGKRNLTKKLALKLAEKLNLSPHQIRTLLTPLEDRFISNTDGLKTLNESEFSLISNWIYFAILSLGSTTKNKADVKWISRRLGISEEDAARAFNRLLTMNFITISKNGSFKQSSKPLTISSETGSQVIRNYHKQNLELASERLEKVDVKFRDYSSMTMGVHPNKLEKARAMIADFRRALMAEMEMGEKTEVYTLAIQFFPLSKKDEE